MVFTHIHQPDYQELETTSVQGKRWYITPEGNQYPSVTTILNAGPKPWLDRWVANLGPDKAEKEKQRCADRGEAVHTLIERYLQNYENPTEGFSTEYVRKFNQTKPVLNRIDNIRAQEIPLYSDRLGTAGRVDCIGEYKDELAVIDFKTSTNTKDESMVQDYYKQCTAYAIMYFELFGVPIEKIVIIMSTEKGIVPLVFQSNIEQHTSGLLAKINEFYQEG